MSWSKHWDALCAEARLKGDINRLRAGREIEMRTLNLILASDGIEEAWRGGEFGVLGYLAEALATWPMTDLERTDPALFGNLVRGLAETRERGWLARLDAARLHGIEDTLQQVLANQSAEGVSLTPEEVAEVRRQLARQHLL